MSDCGMLGNPYLILGGLIPGKPLMNQSGWSKTHTSTLRDHDIADKVATFT